jgi:hypothetical protein
VLRDLETWRVISRAYATISFTITTADDELGKNAVLHACPAAASGAVLKGGDVWIHS